jgi:hypothetical protein
MPSGLLGSKLKAPGILDEPKENPTGVLCQLSRGRFDRGPHSPLAHEKVPLSLQTVEVGTPWYCQDTQSRRHPFGISGMLWFLDATPFHDPMLREESAGGTRDSDGSLPVGER